MGGEDQCLNGHYFKCVFESSNNLNQHNNIRIPDLSRISGNAKNNRQEIPQRDDYEFVLEDLNKNRKKNITLADFVVVVTKLKFQTCNRPAHPQRCFVPFRRITFHRNSESQMNFLKKGNKLTQVKKWKQVTQHNTQRWV